MSNTEEKRILKAQSISTFLIGSVMLLEIFAGLVTNSLAILGDGIHAFYDFLITGMLLATYRISIKPADESHTYGHSKIKTLGSFSSGIALLYFVAYLMFRSLNRLIDPSQVYPDIVGLLALVYTLVVDFTRITMLSRASKSEASVKASLLHSLADFLNTLIAVIGFFLAGFFNIVQADAVAGLVLSAMMFYLGIKLLYETGLELTDAISPSMVRRIMKILEEEYGSERVSYLNVRKIDGKTYVDIGTLVPLDNSFSNIYRSMKKVESRISEDLGDNTVIRIQTIPKGSSGLYELIRDSALSVEGVSNVHEIIVSKSEDGLLVSLHIEVSENMSLSDAHRIADEVERRVLEKVRNVSNVMVHLEAVTPPLKPVEKIGSNSKLYQSVKDIVEEEIARFKKIWELKRILLFEDSRGSRKIELTVSMDGKTSMAEAHEMVSRLEDSIKKKLGEIEVVIHAEPQN
ncbi:MAG: cation-efflux pump [Crenarchaeota archaeon]|nr:cation-efflux pump [Thermoproteota archaeon]MDW8033647.1 cation diffusion facilitator family transporter [Nitrososphaerota archaeon]